MKFYATFSCIHPLADGWIEINCASIRRAYELMQRHFGLHFSHIYLKIEFQKEYFLKGVLGIINGEE